MAVPLIAVALIQIVVGSTVYLRSDAQIAQLQQQARDAPAAFKSGETPRMKAVIANFELYRRIEIGLLALGMAIVVLLRNREFWFAFGLGLVLQAGFMLALDHFAEPRAHVYFKAVLSRLNRHRLRRSTAAGAEGQHLQDVAVVVGPGARAGALRHRRRGLADQRQVEHAAVVGQQDPVRHRRADVAFDAPSAIKASSMPSSAAMRPTTGAQVEVAVADVQRDHAARLEALAVQHRPPRA